MKPLVSMIIPVFNAEKYIAECIASIRCQNYKNLEVIVVNDGSTDGTDELIKACIDGDPRFVYVARENLGLVATLNQMIPMCRGAFIARMDADDISEPHRIKKQVEFMLNNPEIAVLGSRTELIDEHGKTLGFCKRPTTAKDIAAYFLYGSPLAHPTVMFNLGVLDKADLVYSSDAYPIEDFELWLRLNKKYKIMNHPESLLKYRVTKSGVSQTNRVRQKEKNEKIKAKYYSHNKAVYGFVQSIELDHGTKITRAIKRLLCVIRITLTNADLSAISLLKIWLRTIRRDVRQAS